MTKMELNPVFGYTAQIIKLLQVNSVTLSKSKDLFSNLQSNLHLCTWCWPHNSSELTVNSFIIFTLLISHSSNFNGCSSGVLPNNITISFFIIIYLDPVGFHLTNSKLGLCIHTQICICEPLHLADTSTIVVSSTNFISGITVSCERRRPYV